MELDKSLVSGSMAMLVLKLLEDGDKYGYQMIEELRRRSDDTFHLKAGTLYPLLHGLEEKGLVTAYEGEAAAGKPRRYYRLTKQGSAALREKETAWDTYARAVGRVLKGAPALPETIQAYIEAVEDQIRWKRAKSAVSLELRRHLEDQRDDFAAEGLEDAERLAVEEMGDPVSVGAELDRLHRPRPQWGLLGLTIALACAGAGLRLWFSIGTAMEPRPGMTALSLILGIAALLGMYFLDVSFLARYAKAVYIGVLAAGILTILLLPDWNRVAYYGRYVVRVYPVVYAVWLYSCRGTSWGRFALAVAGGIPLAAVCLLVPDTSGLFKLLFCGLILLLCAIRQGWFGSRRGKYAGTALALAALLLAVTFVTGYGQYFIMRLRIAVHPELDPYGSGYYGWSIKTFLRDIPWVREGGQSAAVSAGMRGRIFGSDGRFLDINMDYDFLPLKLLVERGWLAFLLLLAVLVLLLAWLVLRCLRQRSQLGRLTVLAVVLSLGLETLVSAATNLGFVFFSAHLPLVTGNLHTVIDMALIGLVLSVFRGTDVLRDEMPSEKQHFAFPWRVKVSIISTKSEQ